MMAELAEFSEFDWERQRARQYAEIEIPFHGSSVRLEAGDGNIVGIRGWKMVYGFVGDRPQPSQEVVATLWLRYPQQGNVAYTVRDFDASQGGIIHIPWPRVTLRFRDRCSELQGGERSAESEDNVPSRVLVSFFPTLADEASPYGIRSVVTGRTLVSLTGTGSTDGDKEYQDVDVPLGATSYRIALNATDYTKCEDSESKLYVEERTGDRVWSRFEIGSEGSLILDQGLTLGWRLTPPEPRARLRLHLAKTPTTDRTAVIFWQFDLGASR